jgi:hypothetical protein
MLIELYQRPRKKQTHTPMDTYILIKKPKPYNGKKKASSTDGAGLSGCLHIEECKKTHIYDPAQNSSPSGSKTST